MAFYLVTAVPMSDRLDQLKEKLQNSAFKSLRPFGPTLHHSLLHARKKSEHEIVWEEEDYCSPPLAEEREAVLDDYFTGITVENVSKGEGWNTIQSLPYLFPELVGNKSSN